MEPRLSLDIPTYIDVLNSWQSILRPHMLFMLGELLLLNFRLLNTLAAVRIDRSPCDFVQTVSCHIREHFSW